MVNVKTFDYVSAVKVFAVLGLVGGVLNGLSLMGLFGIVFLGSAIVGGVVGGAIGGIVFAALYNFVLVKYLPIEVETA